MNISFWLNRYQTNKYNAARKIKNFVWFITFLKPTHLFFIPFSNWIIHSALCREKEKCTEHGTRNKSFRRNQKNWMCFFSSVKIVKKYVNFVWVFLRIFSVRPNISCFLFFGIGVVRELLKEALVSHSFLDDFYCFLLRLVKGLQLNDDKKS